MSEKEMSVVHEDIEDIFDILKDMQDKHEKEESYDALNHEVLEGLIKMEISHYKDMIFDLVEYDPNHLQLKGLNKRKNEWEELLKKLTNGESLLDKFIEFCKLAKAFESDRFNDQGNKVRGSNPKFLTCRLKQNNSGAYLFDHSNLRDFKEFSNCNHSLKKLAELLIDSLEANKDAIKYGNFSYNGEKGARIRIYGLSVKNEYVDKDIVVEFLEDLLEHMDWGEPIYAKERIEVWVAKLKQGDQEEDRRRVLKLQKQIKKQGSQEEVVQRKQISELQISELYEMKTKVMVLEAKVAPEMTQEERNWIYLFAKWDERWRR